MKCRNCNKSFTSKHPGHTFCLKCSNLKHAQRTCGTDDYGVGSHENYERMMTASDVAGGAPSTLEIFGDGPCDDCENQNSCISNSLACKTFYDWSELKRSDWPDRVEPNRHYYVRMFPRDRKVGSLKTIRDRLKFILKLCCNGHGMSGEEVYQVSLRMGFGLHYRRVKTNLNAMVYQGHINRLNGEFYPMRNV
jgi:hypothetical protein